MKYILVKDLPFAKAGAIVVVGGYTKLIQVDGYTIGDDNSKHRPSIQKLIEDGWIEEVKPREFYINKTTGGELFAYYKKENAIDGSSLDSSETIKVVECI